jgi:hypothetical protein
MALEGGEESVSRPGRSLTLEKTQYPLYRRLRGPERKSGEEGKSAAPGGDHGGSGKPVESRQATQPIGGAEV